MELNSLTRRTFLAGSAATTAAFLTPNAFAGGQDSLKVGLIGCGGRGTGAAEDDLTSSAGVTLWAMGDVFQERVDGAHGYLSGKFKDRVNVTPERKFSGFDAYQKVIASGVDMVILATPPGFRPTHFKAAIDAGKHVFMEKPVAVDAAGVRMVIAAGELAKAKGLGVVAGTQRRHDLGYTEVIKRIKDGAIGDIVACYAYWNQGGLWMNPRQEKWTDMEWQLRNWLYFSWLSGDHICEQHIHNLDVCNWAMGKHPIKAVSLAGRQVRTDAAYGHIFDHFATEYEYEGGVKMLSMCRQIDGTASRVSEWLVGTKGSSNAGYSINNSNGFMFEGEMPTP